MQIPRIFGRGTKNTLCFQLRYHLLKKIRDINASHIASACIHLYICTHGEKSETCKL